ncbi:MAG TPA: gamma-glutamyl-gamma-aminobutyrate hydrolase family protein [Pyrinomonadaceae bacterium]|nr:gamma-glutamyl-gamma-aminobutyrate hydrolase family protein [Pyrinomonadaceae bacterium]
MTIQDTYEPPVIDQAEPLPFPFNQRPFCRFESIEKRIQTIRVLVVNNLLTDDAHVSDVARRELGAKLERRLDRERQISELALGNILGNIHRLVEDPVIEQAHVSEVAEAAESFAPEAVVLSGTLSDFDWYHPSIVESFGRYVRATRTPVLGICGGHQLVGLGFGARVVTLIDARDPAELRDGRPFEYQYRFIKITDPDDPIFNGIHDEQSGLWQDYTIEGRILRVWQNHGLQLDRVPEGFRLLATSYLCKNQMMVRRAEGQLIYAVQFHLEKSFQDLSRNNARRLNPNLPRDVKKRLLREEAESRTRWEHQNESRDGRIIFENFLREALKHAKERES